MSFGFRLINDNGNISVDETNPVYAMIPSEVMGAFTSIGTAGINTGSVILSSVTGDPFGTAANMTFTFAVPLTTQSPPLLFIRPSNIPGNPYSTLFGGYRIIGSPGNWTGIGFCFCTDVPIPGGSGPAQVYNLYKDTCCDFALAVPGGYFEPGYGLRLANTAGHLMFDSNNKHIQITGTTMTFVSEAKTEFDETSSLDSLTKTVWDSNMDSLSWLNASSSAGFDYKGTTGLQAGNMVMGIKPTTGSQINMFGFAMSSEQGFGRQPGTGGGPDGNTFYWEHDRRIYKTLLLVTNQKLNLPPYPT